MKRTDDLILGSVALVAILAILWPRKSAPGVPGGGGGVWEPDTSNEDYTGGTPWPAQPPVNGWEPDTGNDTWNTWIEPLPGQNGGSPTMETTGQYRVPNPDPNKDYFAHLATYEWYINIAGMSPEIAQAQVDFDLQDAHFAAGHSTLNERDQSLLVLEIAQAKARGEDTGPREILLDYLRSHTQYSRYDLRSGVLP